MVEGGIVRTPKESDRQMPTHELETADRGTCQDTERIRLTEAHSLPGDGRQRDLSGYRKNSTDRGPLTSWRRQMKGLVRTLKESDRPRPLTNWRRQTEGLVRTPKESDRPRPTHFLEMVEGGIVRTPKEYDRPTEVYSPPGDDRGRDLSRHQKNPTDLGPLTNWRRKTEGLVRTWKLNPPCEAHSQT